MTSDDRLAFLETKVKELMDRQAIADCIKHYPRGDDSDAVSMAGTYGAGGLQGIGAHRVPGPDLHNVTTHHCEIDGDVAQAESYSLGLFLDEGGETGRVLAERYIDRLERRDGEWRIVRRQSIVQIALEGEAALLGRAALPDPSHRRRN